MHTTPPHQRIEARLGTGLFILEKETYSALWTKEEAKEDRYPQKKEETEKEPPQEEAVNLPPDPSPRSLWFEACVCYPKMLI